VVLRCVLAGGKLREVTLHPVSLGFGLPRGVRGRPALAYGDEAARILARIASLSRRYGTRIEPVDDAARISLD
jgi:hypothetical protein